MHRSIVWKAVAAVGVGAACLPLIANGDDSSPTVVAPTPVPVTIPVRITDVTPPGCLLIVIAAPTDAISGGNPLTPPTAQPRVISTPAPATAVPSAVALAEFSPVCTAAKPTPSPALAATVLGVIPAEGASPTPIPLPTRPQRISPGGAAPQTSATATGDPYGGLGAGPLDVPHILRVELSDEAPVSGERVSGRVVTTTNVDSVVARLGGNQIAFGREDFGIFGLTYTLPRIPFFLKGSYTVTIVASSVGGKMASVDVPVQLR